MRPLFSSPLRLIASACMALSMLGAEAAMAQTPSRAVRQHSVQDTTALTAAIDITITLHPDATAQKMETRRVKVLGIAGVRAAGQLSLSYIDGMQKLEIVEAYTEKPDGRKVMVDRDTLITRDAATGLGAVYLRDLKVVSVIFPDVAIGDTVVLTTRLDYKQGIFAGHFIDRVYFARTVPIADSIVRIVAPTAMPLNVAVYGDGIEDVITREGDQTRHVISYHARPPITAERGSTSALDRDPRILVSTFKNYEDLARSYWRMARVGTAITPEIAKLAEDITRGIGNRRAQAEAISTWVKSNIRYVAVYLGAARVVPHSAASVLKNRYGDCKDKVTLMSALLAAKGIASEHVLISASNAYTLPEPATMGYLNHAIIYLPEFGLYDDPTSSFSSFGVLSVATYDKPVVHVSDNGAHRARTPAMRAEDNVSIRRTRVTIAADGTVSGSTDQIATGIFAASARAVAVALQSGGLERTAEQRLRNLGTPGTGHFEIGSLAELGATYRVSGRFVLNNRVRIVPGRSLAIPAGLPIQAGPGSYLLNVRYANRTLPFVCLAGRQIEEVAVTFAKGLPLPRRIKGRTIDTANVYYRSQYSYKGRTFMVRREFVSRVRGQVCPPQIEAQLARTMRAVNGSLKTRMWFKRNPPKPPAPAHAPDGKPAGAGSMTQMWPAAAAQAAAAAPRVN
jgi:transglutaminase-like putative cysteine protease